MAPIAPLVGAVGDAEAVAGAPGLFVREVVDQLDLLHKVTCTQPQRSGLDVCSRRKACRFCGTATAGGTAATALDPAHETVDRKLRQALE